LSFAQQKTGMMFAASLKVKEVGVIAAAQTGLPDGIFLLQNSQFG
jgi:hypothetical protein